MKFKDRDNQIIGYSSPVTIDKHLNAETTINTVVLLGASDAVKWWKHLYPQYRDVDEDIVLEKFMEAHQAWWE